MILKQHETTARNNNIQDEMNKVFTKHCSGIDAITTRLDSFPSYE